MSTLPARSNLSTSSFRRRTLIDTKRKLYYVQAIISLIVSRMKATSRKWSDVGKHVKALAFVFCVACNPASPPHLSASHIRLYRSLCGLSLPIDATELFALLWLADREHYIIRGLSARIPSAIESRIGRQEGSIRSALRSCSSIQLKRH